MARARQQLLLSLTMLGGALAVAALLYSNRPSTEMAEPAVQVVTVDAAEVVLENISIPVRAQGTVSPLQKTALHSEVAGRVIEVSPGFNVGGFVSRGEVLLRIDPRDYQTSLLRAQASVASAESSLAQEKGRAEVALREWKKLPTGAQRSQEAKDLYLRKPQLEQAEAQLLAARADLDTARNNLERTDIRAPYDALIRAKHSELGQFVSPGTPLAEIFSVETAEVRLPIPQSKLAYLDLPGLDGYTEATEIDLFTDVAGDVSHWRASLHRTEGVYDERSRVLYTVARIDDPYGLRPPHQQPLRFGTFVNADISGRSIPDLVRLPRYVLRAGNHLWVIDNELRLRNRKVSVLRAGEDEIYVSAGLDAGELVSLTALDSSFAGSRVEVVSRQPSDRLRMPGGRDRRFDPADPESSEQDEADIRIAADQNAASTEGTL